LPFLCPTTRGEVTASLNLAWSLVHIDIGDWMCMFYSWRKEHILTRQGTCSDTLLNPVARNMWSSVFIPLDYLARKWTTS
jgi:hypothetical protein